VIGVRDQSKNESDNLPQAGRESKRGAANGQQRRAFEI
jgi:hypothetical protein